MSNIIGEIGLKSRYEALRSELHRLRQSTLSYSKIGSDGNLVVSTTDPGYIELQEKIAGLEAQLLAADVAAGVIAATLGTYSTIRELQEARQRQADIIQGAPLRAFELFRIMRDVAIEHGNAAVRLAMPSEVPALLDGYEDQEDDLKAELTAAQAAMISLDAAMVTISEQTDIARAALV